MPGSPALPGGGAESGVSVCAVEGRVSGFWLTSAAPLGGAAGTSDCEDLVGTLDSGGDTAVEG